MRRYVNQILKKRMVDCQKMIKMTVIYIENEKISSAGTSFMFGVHLIWIIELV